MRLRNRIVSLLATALMLSLIFASIPAIAAPPTDLIGHWAQAEVQSLIDASVITGYPNGTFQPDSHITRAEFVTMVNRAAKLDPLAKDSAFPDVKAGDWFADQVGAAVQAGYIKGNDDGTLKPNASLTRNEAAVIIDRAIGLAAGGTLIFADKANIPSWAATSVAAAAAAGYVKGYPDNTFSGNASITRAEAAVIISRAIDQLAAKMPRPVTITVADEHGAVQPGATVRISHYNANDLFAQPATGSDGTALVSLRPGDYDLNVITSGALGHLKYTVTTGKNEPTLFVGLGAGTVALRIDGPGAIASGTAADFSVLLANTGAAVNDPVNVILFFRRAEDNAWSDIAPGDLTVEYLDPTDGKYKPLPLTQFTAQSLISQFGPAEGFALPAGYSATTKVRVTVNRDGFYRVQGEVDTVGNQAVYGLPVFHDIVAPKSVSLTGAGPATATVGTSAEYSIRLQNTGDALPNNMGVAFIIGRLGGAAAGDVTLEYLDPTDGQYKPLDVMLDGQTGLLYGAFGPDAGFPVPAGYDVTTTIRATFNRAGIYAVASSLVDVTDGRGYTPASTLTVTVN